MGTSSRAAVLSEDGQLTEISTAFRRLISELIVPICGEKNAGIGALDSGFYDVFWTKIFHKIAPPLL
jgi:hypothetical protein